MRRALTALVVLVCLTSAVSANFSRSIDNSGDVGKYVSLVMTSGGTPVIAYYDDTADDLELILCGDSDCASAASVTLDSTNDVGKYTSVALSANGFPAVAYFDDTNDNLKLALCNDAACAGVTLRTIDETGTVGEFVSMAQGTDGFLVGAYYDRTNAAFKMFHCTNATCDTPELIPMTPVGGAGTWLSLKIAPDTMPMVSFYDGVTGDLRLADCSSVGCATVSYITLDATDNVGAFSALGFAPSTRPVVAYYDATNAELKFVECLSIDCVSKSIVTVDTLNTVGQYMSMVMGADGFPLIAYHDVTSADLKFADCSTSDCASRTITLVDTNAGVYSALGVDGAGQAVIAYYNAPNSDLNLALLKNFAPEMNPLTDPTVAPGQAVAFTISAIDADNAPPQTLSYSVVGQVPTGATFNPLNGAFAWTPTGGQIGTYVLVFFASDNGLPSLSDNMTVVITVEANNAPPALDPIGDFLVDEGVLNTRVITASDPDAGQTLSYSVTGLPGSAILHSATGVLTWTPAPTQTGFYTATFTVRDSGANLLIDSETVQIQVRDQLVANPSLDTDFDSNTLPDSWTFFKVPTSYYVCGGGCTYHAKYDPDGGLRQNVDVRWLDVGDILTARASLRPRSISTAQDVILVQVFYPDGTKAKTAINVSGSLPAPTVLNSPPLILTQRPTRVQVSIQLRKRTGGKLIADDVYVFAESAGNDPTRTDAVMPLPLPPVGWRAETTGGR